MLGYGKYSAKICWVGGYANLVEKPMLFRLLGIVSYLTFLMVVSL
jgi:hypothetical protein